MARKSRTRQPPDGSRPHVLIIVQNLPVPLDRRVWLECQTLVPAGYRVSVICPKGPGDQGFEELNGVEIHKYAPPPNSSGLLTYAFEFAYCWLRTAILARRIHRRSPLDVIQACNPPDTFWALARLFERDGVRFVYDQHDLCPEIYSSRGDGGPNRRVLAALHWLERKTYETADHVIATNESYRRIAIDRGRVGEDLVTIVRSGPNVEKMQRASPRPELKRGSKHLCCYLGIMGYQDRVDVVVRAADWLINHEGREDIHFAILGFGDTLDQMKKLASDKGLDSSITFTGRADLPMIIDYLSTADVGLAPDPKTPFNDKSTHNKILEYMAFELPAVAFDLTESQRSAGDAALYAECNNGADDLDVRAFAKAILELLDDPGKRATMGRTGRERVERELGWHLSAPRYLTVYERLLGRCQVPTESEKSGQPPASADGPEELLCA